MSRLDTLKNYRQLGSDLKAGVRETFYLARALPEFFRERVTVERAEEQIKRLLESREERFLELVRSRIYEHSTSPYLKLLKIAGCEFSDLKAEIQRFGLEMTLERLASEGVYLTSDEFKGKKEVVRGGESFRVAPEDFKRLEPSPGFVTQSSGTSGRPVSSLISLDWLAVLAFGARVFSSAHELFSYSHAMYDAILPGAGGTNFLLIYAKLGGLTDRWFARKIPSTSKLKTGYHYLTTYLIVLMGKLFGPGFPRPRLTGLEDMRYVVQWVAGTNREGRNCCITAAASNAVRIARVASEMGVSLHGTKFIIQGEPFTEAKRQVLEQPGARATLRYSFAVGVNVGLGCAKPIYTDEVHVNQHMLAVISHPRPLTDHGLQIRPLLFTTLYSSVPMLLLNVENGDYATFDRRDCGCALGKAGLTLHLHHIRSYEKFTSEGMNYFYGDLFEFFETTLPSEFGGGLGDYQLVEEEDENGQTRLTLVVHPQVGEVSEAKLLLRLQERLAQGSSANRFQAKIWQDAGTFRIRREAPHASARGKILPLHISR